MANPYILRTAHLSRAKLGCILPLPDVARGVDTQMRLKSRLAQDGGCGSSVQNSRLKVPPNTNAQMLSHAQSIFGRAPARFARPHAIAQLKRPAERTLGLITNLRRDCRQRAAGPLQLAFGELKPRLSEER